ncbi:Uncharacterised protein [Segatella copri]|nr:Uncharacterised protein [Segatella copri]
MHNLLIVHILHHQQKLAGNLPALQTGMLLGKPLIKRHAIYPFHHDTPAVSLNFFQPLHLHNTGMVKTGKNIIFLLLKLQEGRIMTHIRLQRFQYPPLTVALGLEQDIETAGRKFGYFCECFRDFKL